MRQFNKKNKKMYMRNLTDDQNLFSYAVFGSWIQKRKEKAREMGKKLAYISFTLLSSFLFPFQIPT